MRGGLRWELRADVTHRVCCLVAASLLAWGGFVWALVNLLAARTPGTRGLTHRFSFAVGTFQCAAVLLGGRREHAEIGFAVREQW